MVFEALNQIFLDIELSTGVKQGKLQSDVGKLMFCQLTAIPFGLIQWKFIKGSMARSIYIIILGVFYAILQFGANKLVDWLASAFGCYALLLIWPRDRVALPVTIFLLGYLSYMHIYKYLFEYMSWVMDETGMQMLMTAKLCSLAYCYQDAVTIKKTPERLMDEQKALIVEERPGILEYSAYVAFYPSILTGPAFEFSDFRRWLRQEAEFSNIPFPGMRSLVIVLQGWTCGFTHLALNAYFPVTYLYDPEFTNNTFLFKAFYIFAAMETFRLKYLVAFSFADAGVISTGLGYKPDRNGNVSWERIRSINLKGYFWSSSIREVINSWNISVNLWLRRYVFNRVLKSDTKPTPSANRKFWAEQITFAVSAFWHGFYPGYYVFFFTMVFVNDLGKFYYQSDFSFIPFSRALDTIWWFYTMFLANYVGVTFALLSLERSFVSMASLNYHPFAWIAITWLFFKVTKYNIKYPRKGKIQ